MIRAVSLLVILFLAAPNLLIIASSFSTTSSFGIPWDGLSLQWYANLFTRSTFGSGLLLSVGLAGLATLIGTAIGTAAAFAVVRYRFPGRGLINALVMGPLIVPEVVMGLSFLIMLNAMLLGITIVNLLLLHLVIVLPFVVRVMIGNLQRTDPDLEAAAQLLGATPARAVVHVTLPIIARGMTGAMLLAFVMSFHNFTATLFLVSSEATLPIAIYQYVRTESDPTVAALSSLLMVGMLGIVLLTSRLMGLDKVVR
ncbi:putative spermidine/putrescine transport system permease protein [Salinihabitans flavidus]|uniref:Putative spermidine/putrescine transport system permease protein n=1 Tax=Salinihabitans flavidus TaxID=569882 RepID=A0A1H8WEZ1_9RHOB|nr:ABC transporter permease [Salinihabitans flavidus]SEP26083.1 putative spermidine/putrescine transport system permease protein [Salinihabitans flavidus]